MPVISQAYSCADMTFELGKLVAHLSSLGKLFHTRADSNLNDLCPYVTVLTVGFLPESIFGLFYLHLISKVLWGHVINTCLHVSVAMHLSLLEDSLCLKGSHS